MTAKEYWLPQSLGEALSLLAEHGPSLLVMAGGTRAMPLINKGISIPEKVLGLASNFSVDSWLDFEDSFAAERRPPCFMMPC